MKNNKVKNFKTTIKKALNKVVNDYQNEKLKAIKFKIPNDMDKAKEFCKQICDIYGIKITFDDEYNNFGSEWNQCISHTFVECAKFNKWNYDLLPIAMLHELGHITGEMSREEAQSQNLPEERSASYNKNTFSREYDAWKWAIDKYLDLFGQNIGIKQGRYIVSCLSTYLPDYNTYNYRVNDKEWFEESHGRFWCPIKKKVIK